MLSPVHCICEIMLVRNLRTFICNLFEDEVSIAILADCQYVQVILPAAEAARRPNMCGGHTYVLYLVSITTRYLSGPELAKIHSLLSILLASARNCAETPRSLELSRTRSSVSPSVDKFLLITAEKKKRNEIFMEFGFIQNATKFIENHKLSQN